MAKTRTSWKPGQSGNPKGRPPRHSALVALLNKRLDRRVRGISVRVRIIDTLIDAALSGDTAIGKFILETDMRSYEFMTKLEITEKLREEVAELRGLLEEAKDARRN